MQLSRQTYRHENRWWYREALGLLQRSGFYNLTLYQEEVIPFILGGKNLVIETDGYKGRTSSFILALLACYRKKKQGIKAVVLSSGPDDALRTFQQFTALARASGHFVALLSEPADVREEIRLLQKSPDFIIATARRCIDHIRRNNIDFSQVKSIIIQDKNNANPVGFIEDIQFIYSKLPVKLQSIIYSYHETVPALTPQETFLKYKNLIKWPRYLTTALINRSLTKTRHLYCEFPPSTTATQRIALTADSIKAAGLNNALIICRTKATAQSLATALDQRKIRSASITSDKEEAFAEDTCIVSVWDCQRQLNLTWIDNLIFADCPADFDEYAAGMHCLTGQVAEVFTFISKEEYFILQSIQEKMNVSMKREELPSDSELYKGMIDSILKQIKEMEDPDELNKFRSLVRRNVPIFLRSYFAAYLFKQSLSFNGKNYSQTVIRKDSGSYTTLFVSIGKNRRVFPKDLIQLFMGKLKLERSDIGEVKIFDNYSFVDIALEKASQAMASLTGSNFRGRRITVNLARKKGAEKPQEQS